MAASRKGPWSESQITQFLEENVIPLRLGCVGGDGFPRVVSVWYLYREGGLLSVSHRDSQLVALLRGSDRVGFEVAPERPPYRGVRGQGVASLTAEGAGEVLDQVLQRYLGGAESNLAKWLRSRRDEEILIRIKPRRLFSWDYRARMRDA
jgi:nitroimidazol reductase NimA-like FMN-containing flavoprotein (pyridoxamine 5'-phosphate oxidase superfamily)